MLVRFTDNFFQAHTLAFKEQNAVTLLPNWNVLEISGKDAESFLQRMSTVDLKKLNPQKAQEGTFLNSKGVVIAQFNLYRLSASDFLMITPAGHSELARRHIEMFHFAEQMTVHSWQEIHQELSVGTVSKKRFENEFKTGFSGPNDISFSIHGLCDLQWLVSKHGSTLWTQAMNTSELSWDWNRYHYAWPLMPSDFSECLGLEASLDFAIAPDKGCYPGQEVVERIRTYGRVQKKIFPVLLRYQDPAYFESRSLPSHVERDGKVLIELTSLIVDKQTQVIRGYGFFHQSLWDVLEPLEINNGLTLQKF